MTLRGIDGKLRHEGREPSVFHLFQEDTGPVFLLVCWLESWPFEMGGRMALQLQSLAGVLVIPLLAWIISENRAALGITRAMMIVITAIAVQVAIALLFLKMPYAKILFDGLGAAVLALQEATNTGAQLLFGYLAGAQPPFTVDKPEHTFLVAFRVLPMILVLSAIVRVLYF